MANKLSNYGDILKLLILSYNRKVMSGWSNYSGIVTSQKMSENEMEYRVSKSSLFLYKGVKEQRVDGNWCFNTSNPLPRRAMQKHLRYTLMGSENCYQIEVLSNQFKNRFFSSTSDGNITLNPYFITGFTDAEGSFTVTIYPDNHMKTGIRVNAGFKIGLNERDVDLLKQIQKFFWGVCKLHYNTTFKSWTYSVNNVKDLEKVIIPHFINYPLLTQKSADFKLFVQIVQ